MFKYETANQKEVRRFRIAQFNGRTATVKFGENTFTGHVRSVQEKGSGAPQCWTITMVPRATTSAPAVPRSTPRFPSFAEQDFY